ncbi:hypothetical protein GCM10011297_07220 [Bacterioplanes sanyensis]|uniref:hypothetical protein n=1 Tax=Bacterioplanes sanyensis TaxID=1249553 RepID=UPI0016760E75|nr:hypothetical protein [Bacterioplanes sanyensis]GGY36680.1 hypothetical protein GCM10011297_07220 [Bacterioplanes sanyensis]
MLKPHYFLDPNAQNRAREAERDAATYHENYVAWKQHALEQERSAKRLARENSGLLTRAKNAESYLRITRDRLLDASNGLAVAGYTNNLAQELMLYRAQLVFAALGLDPNDERFKRVPPELCLGLQGKHTPETLGERALNDGEIREINLRLLCRMEWYDWCLHDRVLSKAENLVLNALLNPSNANAHLRGRAFCDALKGEVDTYHQLKDRAMTVEDAHNGPNSTSAIMRRQFEQERYRFWQQNRIQFGYYEGKPFPSSKETLKVNPKARFDLHLPAGRLARDFGIDIETGRKVSNYRGTTAACVLSGVHGGNSGEYYFV